MSFNFLVKQALFFVLLLSANFVWAQSDDVDFIAMYLEALAKDPEYQASQARAEYVDSYREDPQWKQISDFSEDENWHARITGGVDSFAEVDTAILPGSPTYDVDGVAEQSLGIAFSVSRPDEYQVNLVPDNLIELPVEIERLNIYVQGENNSHNLYFILVNGRGEEMPPLFIGRSNFTGWKMMESRLPEDWTGKLFLKGIRILYNPLSLRPEAAFLYFNTLGGYPWGE